MTTRLWSKFRTLTESLRALSAPLLAALLFYTALPLPMGRSLDFRRVARWLPLVGLIIGGLLVGLDSVLSGLGMPLLVRSALLVVVWVGITGGLHLDGAMDTADGLAVMDPERRLAVMADSRSGAFGVMAAIALLLLKTTALAALTQDRGLALLLATGWGRWSQQVAIACYPYLKAEGKGAFHKAALPTRISLLPGLLLLLGLSLLAGGWATTGWRAGGVGLLGGGLAIAPPAWLHHKLGGHTGDTYGAVVEWTEALFLVCWTMV